jgi:hypothetical protein
MKYMPLLKIELLGVYIQKAEITKKSKESPNKMLKKKSGCPDLAL